MREIFSLGVSQLIEQPLRSCLSCCHAASPQSAGSHLIWSCCCETRPLSPAMSFCNTARSSLSLPPRHSGLMIRNRVHSSWRRPSRNQHPRLLPGPSRHLSPPKFPFLHSLSRFSSLSLLPHPPDHPLLLVCSSASILITVKAPCQQLQGLPSVRRCSNFVPRWSPGRCGCAHSLLPAVPLFIRTKHVVGICAFLCVSRQGRLTCMAWQQECVSDAE